MAVGTVEPVPQPNPRGAAVAAAVTVVLWASAFVGIRAVGVAISPGALAFGRLLIGSAALGVLLIARRQGPPPRKVVPRAAVCGVVWFAAYNVFLNAGERLVDAGTAAMLVNVGPIFIAILAGIFLKEGFPRPVVGGAAIAFLGTIMIGAGGGAGQSAPLAGVALCLLAAVAYALGAILQKPVLAHASALQITWVACTAGAAVCLPFARRLAQEVAAAPPATLWWLVFLGVFPTAVAFTTWAYALRHTTAGRMGATTYAVPPITVVMGWLLLREVPPSAALIGGAVCLVGVAIARRGARPAPVPVSTAE